MQSVASHTKAGEADEISPSTSTWDKADSEKEKKIVQGQGLKDNEKEATLRITSLLLEL